MRENEEIKTLWKLRTKFRWKVGQEVWVDTTSWIPPTDCPQRGVIKEILREGLLINFIYLGRTHFIFNDRVYPTRIEDL